MVTDPRRLALRRQLRSVVLVLALIAFMVLFALQGRQRRSPSNAPVAAPQR